MSEVLLIVAMVVAVDVCVITLQLEKSDEMRQDAEWVRRMQVATQLAMEEGK